MQTISHWNLLAVCLFFLASVLACLLACMLCFMIGSCAQDTSASCPLGWKQDVNFDCLAPTNYEGRCVVRKDFRGMSNGQKAQWAHACGVEWCALFSKTSLDAVAHELFRYDHLTFGYSCFLYRLLALSLCCLLFLSAVCLIACSFFVLSA